MGNDTRVLLRQACTLAQEGERVMRIYREGLIYPLHRGT